jgi:hypothetical protein
MPSIVCPKLSVAYTAATAAGVLTVASTTDMYPGANAWVIRTDNGLRARVKILKVLSGTTLKVRRWPTHKKTEAGTNGWDIANYDKENSGPPGYGISDMTAFNSAGKISIERQAVPVDPQSTKRELP